MNAEAYAHALQTLVKHQTMGDSTGFSEELVRQRLQVVVAMQQQLGNVGRSSSSPSWY